MEPPEAGARWLGRLRGLPPEDIEEAVQDALLADHQLQQLLDSIVDRGTALALSRIDELDEGCRRADPRRSRTYRFKIGVNAARQVARRGVRRQMHFQNCIRDDELPSTQVELAAARDGGAEAAVQLKGIGLAFEEARVTLSEVDRAIVEFFLEPGNPAPSELRCWTSLAIALEARAVRNNRGQPWAAGALRKRFQRLPAMIRDWLHVFG